MKWIYIILVVSSLISCGRREKSEQYYASGMEKMAAMNFEGALKDFTMCVSYNRQNHEGFYQRGMAFFKLKQYKMATANFVIASKMKPDNAEYKRMIKENDKKLDQILRKTLPIYLPGRSSN